MSDRRRVFILGLDGATFDVIDPMIERGELPNLARVMEEGTRGILRSTTPPNSSVAWSTMMTGKDPGGHGIYYFRERKLGEYRRALISSRSLKAKTLWRIINEAGGRTGVLNVPVTYPPEPVDGFLISGLLAPHRGAVFTHPPSLHLELIKEFGEYPLDNEAQNIFYRGDQIRAIEHQFFTSKRLLEVTRWLMDRFPWSFFMTVFTATDRVQHAAWRYRMEEYRRRRPRECEKFGEMLPLTYRLMDEHVGEILDALDDDTTLIILSDHGFGPIRHKFYINRWLIEQGYLVLKSRPGFRYDPLTTVMRRLGLGKYRLTPPPLMNRAAGLRRRLRYRRTDWEGYFDVVDWSKTRAFSSFSSGEEVIFINRKGREPHGIVDASGFDSLRAEIAGKLVEVKDEQGEPIVEKVYRGEELYHGPFVDLAPDLQFVTREDAVLPRSELFAGEILVRPPDCFPAMHRREGIVMIRSPEARRGFDLGEAHLRDVAPTTLYFLDIPVPDDMDGRVVTACLSDGVLEKRPIRTAAVGRGGGREGDSDGGAYSPEEEEEVIRALKGLGYMG